MIRTPKRTRVDRALVFLLTGLPVLGLAANVYVVLSSDTSIWHSTTALESTYANEFQFDVFSNPTGVFHGVFDETFRNAHTDSAGQPFTFSWFMLGGAYFQTGTNTNAISTTFLIRRLWGAELLRVGDEIAYHFHHYAWTGSAWVMADTFAERAWDFDWTLSQMVIDESILPVSFRSGWNYIDTPYENYLEPWIPFRLEGGGWMPDCTPYHPSVTDCRLPGTMKGWEVRHYYMKDFTTAVANSIFATAAQGNDQVVCIWSHQNETDFLQQIASVDQVLHWAWANHPATPFFYLTAREAMARYQAGLASSGATLGAGASPAFAASAADAPSALKSSLRIGSPSPATITASAATTDTLVADNDAGAPAYTETGVWTTSASRGYNGGTYRYAVAGSAATATWEAQIPQAGYYDVYAAFLQGANRATQARFIVHAPDGDHEVDVNQNGSVVVVERFVGRFLLEAGPVSVTLDAANSQGTAGQVVISDAVLLQWATDQAPLPLDRIVVDNDSGAPVYTETGTWTLSSSTGYNGGIYRYSTAGSAATATWNALIPRSGYYDVFAAFRQGANRVDLAHYIIHAADGGHAFYVNQYETTGSVVERFIGRCWLEPGSASVTLDAQGSVGALGQAVISDAIVFLWASEQVPLPSPTPTPSPTPSPTPPPTLTPLPPLVLTSPPLQLRTLVQDNSTTVTILTDPAIYPVQPWVAARTYFDQYLRLDTRPTSPGVWMFSYDRSLVDVAVVGVCDLYGNAVLDEVRDGSRRITNQSEFYRCHPWNIDFMSKAGQVTLAADGGGLDGVRMHRATTASFDGGPVAGSADVGISVQTSAASSASSGTLLYEYDARVPVQWTGARIESDTPTGTSVWTRYRFADRRDDLEAQPWSSDFASTVVTFPAPIRRRFIQCEILLETSLPSSTPVLDSFEVYYAPWITPWPSGLILF